MPPRTILQRTLADLDDHHFWDKLLLPVTLPFAVHRFLQDRPSPAAAKAQLRQALETREARFLALVRARVFGAPDSPYRKLFDHAGCDIDDVEASLKRSGLEETLKTLAAAGVYLMPDEYKGREAVKRGSLSFHIRGRNLAPRRHFGSAAGIVKSSGSSDKPSSSVASFDWWRDVSPAVAPFFEAHNLFSSRVAIYEPVVGSLGGMAVVLMAMRLGVPIERCFLRPVSVPTWWERLYFNLTFREIALAARFFGPGFAQPQTVEEEQLDRIISWVRQSREDGHTTCIRTVASNAARIARTADEIGASLEGCTFMTSGEPMTPAKRQSIEKVGGAVAMTWGYWPISTVGMGCSRPAHGDDMHVTRHSMAVIEHPEPLARAGDRHVHPLLLTTLYPTAAQLEINVSNGDLGELSERHCGCPMHDAGLTLHVHNVGSFEKLTSEGLAVSFGALHELIESTLPDRFGGGTGDYQLVEEEAESGQSHLSLLVDPRVGDCDEAALLEFLTEALAAGSRGNRHAAGIWRDAGTLRIVREKPRTSARGKIAPMRSAS